tara:strand:+ start:678 stop:1217 length:540 start_codon:yes stop_codon:yes gene_type:complete
MIITKIPEELKQEVWRELQTRELGNRGKADGSKQDQLTGMLGEIMVKQLFKIKHEWSDGFDGGYDLKLGDLKFDVKTMLRKVDPEPDYVFNVLEFQKDLDSDAYIFCSINKRTSMLWVCGWISKEEFFKKAEKFEKGKKRERKDGSKMKLKANNFEIKIKELNPIQPLLQDYVVGKLCD